DVVQWVEVTFNGRPVGRVDRDGRHTVALPPPYHVADRNELRFRHRYELGRGRPVDPGRYRIGRTAVLAPADIEVLRAGKEAGTRFSIRINGREVSPDRRGYNVVVLDRATGQVAAAETFDTFRSQDESRRMARFIDGLTPGTVVVASVKDDGGGQLTEDGVQALRSLGGQADLQRTLFRSHLLVGAKGAPAGAGLASAGEGRQRGVVGARARL